MRVEVLAVLDMGILQDGVVVVEQLPTASEAQEKAGARKDAFAYGRFLIYGDGEKKQTIAVSPTELKPIAVNVKDVGTLRIVVEGPNFTGLSAYVTLADARISQ